METQLINVLKRAGVKCREYRVAPFGNDVFALTIDKHGTVLVHQGRAKINEAHASKEHKQAVASISEGGRSVTRNVNALIHTESPKKDPTRADMVRRLIAKFDVIMPRDTKWSVRNIHWERIMDEDVTTNKKEPTRECRLSGRVTARVKGHTVNHLLIGMDETRNFISPLPRPAKSVLDAHRMLRPNRAKKRGTVRQGEWFFVPVTNKLNRMITIRARHNPDMLRQIRLGGGTHKALSTIRYGTQIYARGYIVDPRRGHHKSLYLPKWHMVVKNKEAILKVSPAQREAGLRRVTRWD